MTFCNVHTGRLLMQMESIKRQIEHSGTFCDVFRTKKDEYGEDLEETELVKENLFYLFHTTKGYVKQIDKTSSVLLSKDQPKMMVAYSSTEGLRNGDFVYINNVKYKIIEINNIQNYNIVADISLEVVQGEF